MCQPRDISVKNIICKSSLPGADFAANPYGGCLHACRYCYASFMRHFTDHSEAWGKYLDVKNWSPCKKTERFRGRRIFLSSVTDPYQPAEESFMRTRTLLEELRGSGCILSISTKSDLVLRDLELIRSFPNATVAWSINTLDPDFQGQMDNAASIERRIRAMRLFHEAGIKTACFIAPIFPEISKVTDIIEEVRKGCDTVWIDKLNLRGPVKYEIMEFIRKFRPRLLPLYRDIYYRGNSGYWRELDEELKLYSRKNSLPYPRGGVFASNTLSGEPEIINFIR